MFKTPEDLKEFITWARSLRIKSLHVGEVRVEFSELAFVDSIEATELKESSKTLVDDSPEQSKEDEELLYWSTGR